MNDQVEGDIPIWLDAMIDQRLAKLSEAGVFKSPIISVTNTVMTSLTEPEHEDLKPQWERTCDGCGVFCQPEDNFYTGHAKKERDLGDRKLEVVITFGFCETCKTSRF